MINDPIDSFNPIVALADTLDDILSEFYYGGSYDQIDQFGGMEKLQEGFSEELATLKQVVSDALERAHACSPEDWAKQHDQLDGEFSRATEGIGEAFYMLHQALNSPDPADLDRVESLLLSVDDQLYWLNRRRYWIPKQATS